MNKAKTKKRAREKNLSLHYNQTRLNRVLAALGVTDLHKTLHSNFREYILNNPDLPMVVDCKGGVVPERMMKHLKRWKALTYKGISSSDFTEVMFPLIRNLASAVGLGLMAGRNNHKSKEVSKELFLKYAIPAREFLNYFTDQFDAVVQLAVWEEMRPDQPYVAADLDVEDIISENKNRTRSRFKVTVNIEPVKRVWVWNGWKYQVGTHYRSFFTSLPKMQWLSKCPLAYGLPGELGENLPVYISGHAISRILERLDERWIRMVALFFIYSAMDNPVFYPLNDGSGDVLVELRVKEPDLKTGYFVVSRTKTEIIIKTFLFITMYKTPEGNKLHRRLRMARPDYDFHKLDKYSTLAHSDITTHPTLKPIWNECGFGGLLALIDQGVKIFETKQKKQADDLIKYFRLEGV